MTVNKAHGTTCDATMMLGDDLLYRELAYEAMSRGRNENRIYMSRTTDDRTRPPARRRPPRPAPRHRRRARHPRRRPRTATQQAARPRQHRVRPARDVEHHRPGRRTSAQSETILDQAPPTDPADLAALGRSRTETRATTPEPAGRQSPSWRAGSGHARTPSARLRARRPRSTTSTTSNSRPTASTHEIAALHASQHRRASHLVAHRADASNSTRSSDVLNDRLRHQIEPYGQQPADLHHQDPRRPPARSSEGPNLGDGRHRDRALPIGAQHHRRPDRPRPGACRARRGHHCMAYSHRGRS